MNRIIAGLLILALQAALPFLAGAQTTATIRGEVCDSATNAPVPYASVMLKRAGWGKLTDENGNFKIPGAQIGDTLIVSAMGYSKRAFPYKGEKNKIKIALPSTGVQLAEVVVRPRKEKYSKKNNPAVDFVNRIRNASNLTDPRRNDYYNYNKYERITIGLNNINPETSKNVLLRKFKFLRDHIDTSEVSGRPVLNLSVREKTSDIHYRRNPKTEKEHIIGVRQSGLDDFLDEENMRILYEDFFSDINLYGNDIYLLHNEFVSPLGRLAPDFYKFYLTDTVTVDTTRCVELTFVPHNSQSFGFVGKVYVPVGDSTMFIRKVVMSVPHDINLNFIEKMYINQEFERAPDGSRLLVRDDLMAEISLIPGTQGIYIRRNTAYDNHNFEPAEDESIYNYRGQSLLSENAKLQTDQFWDSTRLIALRPSEAGVPEMAKTIRKFPLYYWGEKIVKVFATGYINTDPKDSKFDIGPVYTVLSHNSLEGYRLRVGGMTTANLNPRFFASGYGAYGFRDHKWKYGLELEYSFRDKIYHSREFPMHSLRFTTSYDVDMLGQHYAFTYADNMFLSFKRHDDYQITYLRKSRLDYILELENHFSIDAAIEHQRQEATVHMPFVNGHGKHFGHYNETGVSVTLRYAPGEKFYQTKTERIPIAPKNPVVELTHYYAPRNALGNMFEVNMTELSVSKRFWFSAFGRLDAIVKGAHLWSKSPYPNLLIPNANLSYTIQNESFSLMNPMEFLNDSYVALHMTYWGKGVIFNYVPLLKKLKLRETISFRGLWGHLSKRNRPELHPELFRFPELARATRMTAMPYMEVGVGVDNIFKILRFEYVWRLSYRDGMPASDLHGPRIALHFSF